MKHYMNTLKKLFRSVAVRKHRSALRVGMACALIGAAPLKAQQTDGYASLQSAQATNYSEVVFVGAPTKSIVLKSIDYRSDTNTAFLHFYSGTTPYTITGVINGTNLTVTSNAGVISNQLCIIQLGATQAWTATVLSTNNLTNIFLAGGATLGFTPATNAVFWNCTNRHLRVVNVAVEARSSEALFAAQVRAPLSVRIDPGVVSSNRLNATVLYRPDGTQ